MANDVGLRADVRRTLARMRTHLDLRDEQVAAWDVLVETFAEVGDAIDAAAAIECGEQAPGLQKALDAQARQLAVQLCSVRRIASATANLERFLVPRQRKCADRLLRILCRELGFLLPSARPSVMPTTAQPENGSLQTWTRLSPGHPSPRSGRHFGAVNLDQRWRPFFEAVRGSSSRRAGHEAEAKR